MVKVLSIALMNEPGTFAHVAQLLAQEGLNVEAWTADSQAEIGVARILVDDPERGYEVLRQGGHPVQMIRGLKLTMKNEPGELAEALAALGREHVNIIMTFGSTGESDRGEAVFVVPSEDAERAKRAVGGV